VLFGPFLVFVLVVALFGLSFLIPGGPWPWLVVGALGVVVAIRWTLWPLSGHDMPLSRLNDVSFSHNILERMLGCGTLVVESAGEQGQLKLDDIPKVELVQHTLHRLSDDLRGVEGADDVDPGLARSLDDAFDDEYRGPVGGGTPNERQT
jgi:hypothetical protein